MPADPPIRRIELEDDIVVHVAASHPVRARPARARALPVCGGAAGLAALALLGPTAAGFTFAALLGVLTLLAAGGLRRRVARRSPG